VLSEKGYRMLSAAEGNEGLRIAGNHREPIDLLLTDMVMPRMGGRELANRLEAARPGLKVLFMSGYTEDAVSHRGVLKVGLSYLQKPFTSDALVRKVRETLDRPAPR
jgi:CheY-like chemotaxis protein